MFSYLLCSLQCIYSSFLEELSKLKSCNRNFSKSHNNKEMEIHICIIFQRICLHIFQATHIVKDFWKYWYKSSQCKIIFFSNVYIVAICIFSELYGTIHKMKKLRYSTLHVWIVLLLFKNDLLSFNCNFTICVFQMCGSDCQRRPEPERAVFSIL